MSDKVKSPLTGRPITIGSSTFNSILKQGWKYIPDTKSFIKDDEQDITPNPQPVAAKPVIAHTQPVIQPEPTPPTIIPLNIPPDFHPKFIVHLSDIHIPVNLHISRQAEYDAVFQNLYSHLKTLPLHQTLIVVTGDLVNTKLKTENETLILAQSFLSTLASLTHTIVIIGNHDFAENNTDRVDSITAICHTLPQVHVLKYTAIYTLPGISLVFNSLLDQKFIKRKQVSDSSNPVYALYHGSLVGSTLDNGGAVTSHKTKFYPTIADFHGYDAALLGHIHLRQFIRPNIAYAGSLIQQKFNEHPTQHGFILWNLETHTGQPVDIPNPYAYTILQVSNGTLDPQSEALLTSLKDKKLRIRCDITDTTTTQIQALHDSLATQYHIETFTTKDITKHKYDMTSLTTTVESTLATDIELIQKMAKPTLVKDIIALHSQLRTQETIQSQSISWRPIYMEFTNLFIYGNNFKNTVNFLDGVVNICAPNTAGKSSIVNIMLFALFDGVSTCKSSKSDILHKGATHGYVSIDFLSNGVHYNIRKEASHKTRTAQRDSSSAIYKTTFTMNSNGKQANLNGTSETATHKIIQEYVGTKEQFLNNCMICTRMAGTSLLNMSPADLAKHMHTVFNLSHYDDYILKARQAQKLIKTQITKLETLNAEYADKLVGSDTVDSRLSETKEKLQETMHNLDDTKSIRDEHLAEIATIKQKIRTLKPTSLSIHDIQLRIQKTTTDLAQFSSDIIQKAQQYSLQTIRQLLANISSQITEVTESPQHLEEKLLDSQSQLQQLETTKPTKTKDSYLMELGTALAHQKELTTVIHQVEASGITATDTDIQKSQLLELVKSLDARSQVLKSQVVMPQDADTLQKMCSILDNDDTPERLLAQQNDLIIQIKLLTDKLTTITYKKPTHNITKEDLLAYDEVQQVVPDRFHVNQQQVEALREKLQSWTDEIGRPDVPVVTFQGQQWVLYQDHLDYAKDAYFRSLNKEYLHAQQQLNHNLMCDQIARQNQAIIERAETVKLQLAWFTYNDTQKDISQLKAQLDSVLKKLEAIQARQQLQIKRELLTAQENAKHFSSQILWLDKDELRHLQDSIKGTQDQIKWHDNHQAILANIEHLKVKLATAHSLGTLLQQQTQLQTYEHIVHMQDQRIELQEMATCSQEIETLNSSLLAQEQSLHYCNSHIRQLEGTVQQLQTDLDELVSIAAMLTRCKERETELLGLNEQDAVYTEYCRLFNKNGIPATILEQQLELLSAKVNVIFHKYTGKYHFRCILDKLDDSGTQKIRLLIETTEHIPLDYSRLSGFESVVLNIAINKALNDLERRTRSAVFVIDESLDCIDQDRFHQCLPDIFDLLRHNFATVLVISHRDIPRQLVDHNLTINKYQTYSTVDA